MHPFLLKLHADGGHHGPVFQSAVRKILRQIDVAIVKCTDLAKGSAISSKRWIVERTIVWLNRCRRLAKDWECRNRNALAFLRLASIRLVLRKLCQKTLRSRIPGNVPSAIGKLLSTLIRQSQAASSDQKLSKENKNLATSESLLPK